MMLRCVMDGVLTLVTTISCPLGQSNGSLACKPTMPHRHAMYDPRRATDGYWLRTSKHGAEAAVLGSLYESYRGFLSQRY